MSFIYYLVVFNCDELSELSALQKFDDKLFICCQFLHLRKPGLLNRIMGTTFQILDAVMDLVFSYEIWLMLILALSVTQFDYYAAILNDFLVFNIVTV